MDKSTVKTLIKEFAIGICLAIVFVFILSKCTSCGNNIEVKKSDNDSLYAVIRASQAEILILKRKDSVSVHKTDSLDKQLADLTAKFNKGSKKVRGDISKGRIDTVEIITVLNQCDSVIESGKATIAQRDTTINILRDNIKEQEGMVDASREIIKNKDQDIENLEEALKKTKRRNKIKTALIIIGDVIKDGLLIFVMRS